MSELIMAAFEHAFGPSKTQEKPFTTKQALARKPTRGFNKTRLPGMTDKEYRLSIRKAHMMGAGKLLCGADNKAKKGPLPFLVTRNWQKVTCGKCLSLKS